jgi:hypothetical protein
MRKTMNNMKSTILGIFAVGMAAALLFQGCKPTIEGELGEPFDKSEGIAGTWELSSFTQKDLNSPVQEVRDLSGFFIDGIATPLQLTFNRDGSYNVALEMGKNYFGDGGQWMFDDPDYPSFIELHTEVDTLVYDLGSMVRSFDNTMKIEYRRACNGTATNIYTFEFNRLN